MTTIHTLASGSAGNALLVSCDDTHILVDAGISCRRITTSFSQLGLTAAELDAVLITHTHGDHIAGLRVLMKKADFPVFASHHTRAALYFQELPRDIFSIAMMEPFLVGSCMITPFPTSHDAPGSCGYRIDTPEGSVGILTDTGFVTPEARETLCGVDTAVLETNHDVETLESGPYPYALKCRVLGMEGHLCNEDAARFAAELVQNGTQELILAHLSEENNTPAMARNAVKRAMNAIGAEPIISVAPRSELSCAHVVSHQESLCRR